MAQYSTIPTNDQWNPYFSQSTYLHPYNSQWQHATVPDIPQPLDTNSGYDEPIILGPSPQHPDSPLHALYARGDDRARSPSSFSSDHDAENVASSQELRYTPDLVDHELPTHTVPAIDDYTAAPSPGSRQASVPYSTSTASTSSKQSVKVEPDDPDGCFIMELPSAQTCQVSAEGTEMPTQFFAPPAEVPLRATYASREMRKMMGSFRVNPFTMHGGDGKGMGPEARALEEEPLIFEFQLDLEGGDPEDLDSLFTITKTHPILASANEAREELSKLRPFSPGFDLHQHEDRSDIGVSEPEPEPESEPEQYEDSSEWGEYEGSGASELGSEPGIQPTMEISYPPQRPHRLHTTTSHPYLRRSLLHAHASAIGSSPQLQARTYPQSQNHLAQHSVHAIASSPQTSHLQQPTHHNHHSYQSDNSHLTNLPLQHTQLTSYQPPPDPPPSLMHPRARRDAYPEPPQVPTYVIMPPRSPQEPDMSAYSHPHSTENQGYEDPSSAGPFVHSAPVTEQPQPQYSAATNPRRWSLPETSLPMGHHQHHHHHQFLQHHHHTQTASFSTFQNP